MNKFRLIIISLLLVPVIFLGWLTATEQGLNWAWRQAEFYLPLEVSINKLEGKLIGPLSIKGFEYQQDGVMVNAQQITIDWLATALLAANINISQLHIESLNIIISETGEAISEPDQPAEQAIKLPDVYMPWRLLLHDVEINDFNLVPNGQTIHLNRIKLDATTLFSRIRIKQLSIEADQYNIAVKGKLQPAHDYPHDLDINWQYALPDSETLKGKGKLAGSMQTTRLQQSLSGPLKLTLDTELNDVLEHLHWKARLDIRQFDLTKLNNDWPALSGSAKVNASGDLVTALLTGNMLGHYPELGKLHADFDLQRLSNNTIQINQLKLQAPEQNTWLNADGLWRPGERGGDVELSLNWQNLRWPAQGTPWFDSAQGSGTIAGNIDDYQITLDTDSPWPLTAPSLWHASATGNLSGMKVHKLRINALSGETIVSGKLDWSRQFNWQAEGKFSNIDPAARWRQWPGQLHGRLNGKGRVKNGQLIIETDVKQITGTLRGYPVSLQSRLAWRNDHLDITELNYRSGSSSIELSGRYGETHDLNWSLSSQQLAELYPETGGQLQAKGRITGTYDTPIVSASFYGNKLLYPGLEITAINGEISTEFFRWRELDIQLAAKGLTIYDTRLNSLDINTDQQLITSKIVTENISADIELNGRAESTGWHGQIEKANISSDYFDNWHLVRPVPVSLKEKYLLLENLCWHSNQQAGLCASFHQQETSWQSTIVMNKVPLKIFEHWLPEELKLEGTADATAKVEYQFPENLLAQLDITLPAGAVNYPMLSGEKDLREYQSGKLQLVLNKEGLKASTDISMKNGDNLATQLTLPGYKPLSTTDTEQPLQASISMQAKELRILEIIFPELYDVHGELKVDVTASGTLENPLVSGNARLVNGSMQIPGLGLNIKHITLSGHSFASREFNFKLDAQSGDGKLEIAGRTLFDRDAGWPTEITITGNDFEAAHIPEAKLTITPDLKLKIASRRINVEGSVHIPYANLQPKDITRAAKVSSDAIIVSDERITKEKWLIITSVRVTLGERVHFYGFGFEGRLGGSLLLEDEPGQLTRATGEINIPEGNYRAYGQRLEVENGRILYTGSPLTNPGLDIRAVRKVDNVTAGIHVKGTLNQLRLEIFSSPAMSQTDALAYLILGGPIENASNEDGAMLAKAALALGLSGGDTIARSLADQFGVDVMRIESSSQGDQASLVVGRYLSPKIYVSYGLGLIESINTITMRYQVSKKWQIKVESGEYHGADILYTIER
jgi:translocation and assembly module TamB